MPIVRLLEPWEVDRTLLTTSLWDPVSLHALLKACLTRVWSMVSSVGVLQLLLST
jgi:hypothetical protein